VCGVLGTTLVKVSEFLYNGNGDTMKDKKIKKIPYGLANYEKSKISKKETIS